MLLANKLSLTEVHDEFDSYYYEYEFKYVHGRYDHVIAHVTNVVSNIEKLEHGILNICSQQSKIATSITDKNFKNLTSHE